MSSESFFTEVVLSYQKILSRSERSAPCLRDYCRSRHVAYRDFRLRVSTNLITYPTGVKVFIKEAVIKFNFQLKYVHIKLS